MHHWPSSRLSRPTYWQLLHRIINFLIGLHILQNAVDFGQQWLFIHKTLKPDRRPFARAFSAMFAICIKLPSWNGHCANLLFVFIRWRYFSCGRLGNQRLSIRRCLHLRCWSSPTVCLLWDPAGRSCEEIRLTKDIWQAAWRLWVEIGGMEIGHAWLQNAIHCRLGCCGHRCEFEPR